MQAMTFSTHILSLNAMALMVFGELGEGEEIDLDAARHVIDTLAVLKAKTQGNLTDDEVKLLDEVLHSLRVKFIQHQK